MSKRAVLITGAGGEVGHGLIDYLAEDGGTEVVACDLKLLGEPLASKCSATFQGDILDQRFLEDLSSRYSFDTIFHLAAILSSGGEKDPTKTHLVNVDGAVNVLNLAERQAERADRPVRFVFPSSIAVYGLPGLAEKQQAGAIREDQFLKPITMYGINKLYVEHLGRYYSCHYRLLDGDGKNLLDFRSLRFPGILCADTEPSGGTSDFGPEMLHAAGRGETYSCFVGRDARLPFMVLPDAVKSMVQLSQAPRGSLSRTVYNVTAFSLSAEDIAAEVRAHFPTAEVDFNPGERRLGIVNSWPADVNDEAARTDWAWRPDYDVQRAFGEYLVPKVKEKYRARD